MPQPAELIWARYDKDNFTKHYLLLFIGEHDNATAALIADKVPDNEVAVLRVNLNKIRTYDIKRVGEFIKENMPISYKNAYRHFSNKSLHIERSLGLSPLEPKKKV